MNVLQQITRSHRANICFFFSLFVLWICGSTVLGRLRSHAYGTVIESVSRDEPRRVVYHTIQAPDGSLANLVCGPTDGALPRALPKGTFVDKKRGQIGYSLNQVYRLSFPLALYAGGVVGALALFAYGIRCWLQACAAPPA